MDDNDGGGELPRESDIFPESDDEDANSVDASLQHPPAICAIGVGGCEIVQFVLHAFQYIIFVTIFRSYWGVSRNPRAGGQYGSRLVPAQRLGRGSRLFFAVLGPWGINYLSRLNLHGLGRC